MTKKADGEGDADDAKAAADAKSSPSKQGELPQARVQDELEVPPTRPSQVALSAEPEPPIRQSAIVLMADPAQFPNDGPISHKLRELDRWAGVVEQVVLFGLLCAMVLVATVQALATKIFQHSFLWSFDVVRAGTFAIAMIGAAFASRFASHLSMDVLSRFLMARKRLALRVVLALFTMFAASLLLYSGLHLRAQVASEGGSHTIPPDLIATMIPAGAALIIFHTLLHMLIDIDYLRRGKLPPEKAPTGH